MNENEWIVQGPGIVVVLCGHGGLSSHEDGDSGEADTRRTGADRARVDGCTSLGPGADVSVSNKPCRKKLCTAMEKLGLGGGRQRRHGARMAASEAAQRHGPLHERAHWNVSTRRRSWRRCRRNVLEFGGGFQTSTQWIRCQLSGGD
jgi:hypothetical protein